MFGTKDANLWYKERMPLRMGVTLKNFGRLPADAKVWSVVTYSTTFRERAESFPEPPDHITVWPVPIDAKSYALSQPLSAADVDSVRQGVGFIYFATKVQYGEEVRHGGFETIVCREYKLKEATNITPNNVPLPLPRLCRDPKSNNAD
jgi:hypothetical protein